MWHKLLRQFSSSFKNEWGAQRTRRVITNYQIYKESIALIFVPLKARFNMRSNYINIKSKGAVMIDFIPMNESSHDPNKVTLI